MEVISEILNSNENKLSEEILIDILKAGTGVLFIGSGTSIRLKYPSWKCLLEKFAGEIQDPVYIEKIKRRLESNDFLVAAEIIKRKLTENGSTTYESLFRQEFGPKEPPFHDFHKLLVGLRVKGFITTNYDPAIGSALRQINFDRSHIRELVISEATKPYIHSFVRSLNSLNFNNRTILHLHGKHDVFSSIVLSYGDYMEKYNGYSLTKEDFEKNFLYGSVDMENFQRRFEEKNKRLRTVHYGVLYSIMATQRLIYIGFGLSDPYWSKIVKDIQGDFHPYNDPSHIALISSNEFKDKTLDDFVKMKEKWIRQGIELVIYKDQEDYYGIDDFISNLPTEATIQYRREDLENQDDKSQSENSDEEPLEDSSSISKNLRVKALKSLDELKKK